MATIRTALHDDPGTAAAASSALSFPTALADDCGSPGPIGCCDVPPAADGGPTTPGAPPGVVLARRRAGFDDDGVPQWVWFRVATIAPLAVERRQDVDPLTGAVTVSARVSATTEAAIGETCMVVWAGRLWRVTASRFSGGVSTVELVSVEWDPPQTLVWTGTAVAAPAGVWVSPDVGGVLRVLLTDTAGLPLDLSGAWEWAAAADSGTGGHVALLVDASLARAGLLVVEIPDSLGPTLAAGSWVVSVTRTGEDGVTAVLVTADVVEQEAGTW